MVAPISSLSNMEMQLYGGQSYNASAPSYYNNYCGTSAYNNSMYANPIFNGYNMGVPQQYGTNFGQTIPQTYMNQSVQSAQVGQQQAQPETIFQGLTQSEQQALMNTYRKGLEPAEKLALGSGVAMQTIMMNPRIVAHPINTASNILFVSLAALKNVEAVLIG